MGRRQGSDLQRCSFCHRDTEDVDRLISGPEDVYICDECVALCVEILEEEKQSEEPVPAADSITDLLPPRRRVRYRAGTREKGPIGSSV